MAPTRDKRKPGRRRLYRPRDDSSSELEDLDGRDEESNSHTENRNNRNEASSTRNEKRDDQPSTSSGRRHTDDDNLSTHSGDRNSRRGEVNTPERNRRRLDSSSDTTTNGADDSSGSSGESGVHLRTPEKSKKRARGGNHGVRRTGAYSDEENQRILKYLIKHDKISQVNSGFVWERIAAKKNVRRSARSLRDHFRKVLRHRWPDYVSDMAIRRKFAKVLGQDLYGMPHDAIRRRMNPIPVVRTRSAPRREPANREDDPIIVSEEGDTARAGGNRDGDRRRERNRRQERRPAEEPRREEERPRFRPRVKEERLQGSSQRENVANPRLFFLAGQSLAFNVDTAASEELAEIGRTIVNHGGRIERSNENALYLGRLGDPTPSGRLLCDVQYVRDCVQANKILPYHSYVLTPSGADSDSSSLPNPPQTLYSREPHRGDGSSRGGESAQNLRSHRRGKSSRQQDSPRSGRPRRGGESSRGLQSPRGQRSRRVSPRAKLRRRTHQKKVNNKEPTEIIILISSEDELESRPPRLSIVISDSDSDADRAVSDNSRVEQNGGVGSQNDDEGQEEERSVEADQNIQVKKEEGEQQEEDSFSDEEMAAVAETNRVNHDDRNRRSRVMVWLDSDADTIIQSLEATSISERRDSSGAVVPQEAASAASASESSRQSTPVRVETFAREFRNQAERVTSDSDLSTPNSESTDFMTSSPVKESQAADPIPSGDTTEPVAAENHVPTNEVIEPVTTVDTAERDPLLIDKDVERIAQNTNSKSTERESEPMDTGSNDLSENIEKMPETVSPSQEAFYSPAKIIPEATGSPCSSFHSCTEVSNSDEIVPATPEKPSPETLKRFSLRLTSPLKLATQRGVVRQLALPGLSEEKVPAEAECSSENIPLTDAPQDSGPQPLELCVAVQELGIVMASDLVKTASLSQLTAIESAEPHPQDDPHHQSLNGDADESMLRQLLTVHESPRRLTRKSKKTTSQREPAESEDDVVIIDGDAVPSTSEGLPGLQLQRGEHIHINLSDRDSHAEKKETAPKANGHIDKKNSNDLKRVHLVVVSSDDSDNDHSRSQPEKRVTRSQAKKKPPKRR